MNRHSPNTTLYYNHIKYPPQHSYSKCCANWTVWRAVVAYGTSTLCLVLFWRIGAPGLAAEMPVIWWWAQKWGSPIRHNLVDSSPETLWHLREHYNLFIFTKKKWLLPKYFKYILVLMCQYTFSHIVWVKQSKGKSQQNKIKHKHTAHRLNFDSQNVWQCKLTSMSQIIYKLKYTLQHHYLPLFLNTFLVNWIFKQKLLKLDVLEKETGTVMGGVDVQKKT